MAAWFHETMEAVSECESRKWLAHVHQELLLRGAYWTAFHSTRKHHEMERDGLI